MPSLPDLSRNAITLFLSQVFLSFPWLLVGILISSSLLVFVDEHRLVARFPRSRLLSSILGSSLGVFVPIGQLGAIPLVRRLLLQGAPLPLAISFLIAAPTINFWVIQESFSLLSSQPRLALLRITVTWVMAMGVAWIFSLYRGKVLPEQTVSPLGRISLLRSGSFIEFSEASDPLHRSGNLIYEYQAPQVHQRPWSEKLRLFLINTMEESLELGFILILTTAIAVALQVFLPLVFPQVELVKTVTGPLEQTLVMMGRGVLFGLGAIANTAFVVPYLGLWWNGALLAFLLTATTLNLSSLGLLLVTFHFKPLLYFSILILQIIFLAAMVLNYYF